MELILASNSPRRKQLLTEYGFDFSVVGSNFEEQTLNLSPEQTVKVNALGKAKDVFEKLGQKDVVVLGSDTVVELNGEILGKPQSEQDAVRMLENLSGKTHSVWTGVAIVYKKEKLVFAEQTKVIFNTLSKELIANYVKSGKPLDKAGAYGIQDGYELVERFDGSFNNVVGLPIEKFQQTLKDLLR